MNVVMAQLNYTVGDIQGNGRQILEVIRDNSDADFIVFSELCITGYYPRDLLYRKSLIESQNAMIAAIAAATAEINAAVVIGAVTRNEYQGKPFHNSLLVIYKGAVVYRYHKQLLPTYGVFDEDRHFEPGSSAGVFEVNGTKVGFLICEDAWEDAAHPLYGKDPVNALIMTFPDLVISINASPCNIYKHSQRHDIIRSVARRCGAPVVYVNQVGGIDDLVFDGGSVIVDNKGMALAQAKYYESSIVRTDVDTALPQPVAEPQPLEMVALQLKRGIADYCSRSGFSKVVIGSSGGIDSAVTLALAAWALGPENVTAITMPGRYSSTGSVDDSVALCEALGVQLLTAPIEAGFATALSEYRGSFGSDPGQLAQENLQARLRGMTLMTYSNTTGSLVLTTGNKSELSVGYCTLHGDMCGGLAVIGDLYKLEVFALAEYLNKEVFGAEVIPRAIIEKPPSAELAPGQVDADALPPYEKLDAILRLFIEGDILPADEVAQLEMIVADVEPAEVKRIHRMVDRNEYKRRQAAPVIRVQRRSFGFDRQIPITTKTDN